MPIVKACHGSRAKISDFLPFTHFGSASAAIQALESVKGRGSERLYVVEIDVRNTLVVPDGNRYPGAEEYDLAIGKAVEAGLMDDATGKRAAETWKSMLISGSGDYRQYLADLFMASGVDCLAYRNVVEDEGSISVVAVDPRSVRLVDVLDRDDIDADAWEQEILILRNTLVIRDPEIEALFDTSAGPCYG